MLRAHSDSSNRSSSSSAGPAKMTNVVGERRKREKSVENGQQCMPPGTQAVVHLAASASPATAAVVNIHCSASAQTQSVMIVPINYEQAMHFHSDRLMHSPCWHTQTTLLCVCAIVVVVAVAETISVADAALEAKHNLNTSPNAAREFGSSCI